MIKFGPSGSSNSFFDEGYKTTVEMPKWLAGRGLDIFEYSFGQGVRLSSETATQMGETFKAENIEISVHAPYFISFGSDNEEIVLKSTEYIIQSLKKLRCFGGQRCVFHPGSEGKQPRKDAMLKIMNAIEHTVEIKNQMGYQDMLICAETMGKHAQIGTVDEILEICKIDESIYPCMDFGHINSREGGSLKTSDDFKRIIDKMLDSIGEEKTKNMHVHFSKIQYGPKGELKHLTFADTEYGPEFEPLARVLFDYKLTPHILSESNGTQAEDAKFMKNYYWSLK
ncbi:MAG: TIM barrel protein [Clostridia bacterium]|nr:TIM barrel protein [Clostridia bacterium]